MFIFLVLYAADLDLDLVSTALVCTALSVLGLPEKSGRSPMLVETLGPASGILDPSELPQENMDRQEDEEEKGSEEEMEEDEDVASKDKEVRLTVSVSHAKKAI